MKEFSVGDIVSYSSTLTEFLMEVTEVTDDRIRGKILKTSNDTFKVGDTEGPYSNHLFEWVDRVDYMPLLLDALDNLERIL